MEKIMGVQVACCVCGKWRLGDEWVEARLTLPEGVMFSHGYCPPCVEIVRQELRDLRAARIAAKK